MEAGEPKVGKGKISAARALPPKTSAQRQIANIFFMASPSPRKRCAYVFSPILCFRFQVYVIVRFRHYTPTLFVIRYFPITHSRHSSSGTSPLRISVIRHQVLPYYAFPSFVVRHFPITRLHLHYASTGKTTVTKLPRSVSESWNKPPHYRNYCG